ncbi:cytochrome c family protein [Geomonas sp. Red32]|uniref:cytochrome c3 family protein n=1 Tax=Geomonas sp. Red32 TaxID=2912856 RepID=UPI00202CD738|nr:cytochrome c3 family protein [Geomonas sp. Red32]MCM0080064.1 cytochrome c family protein [Geomonas sp. Red32]
MPSFRTFILAALALSLMATQAWSTSLPDSVTLNQNGKLYKPFSFDHAKHISLIKECSDCHHHTTGTLVTDPNCVRCHANSSPTAVVSCKGCHSSTPFSPATLAEKREAKGRYHLDKIGLKGAMHENCIGCHSKRSQGPVGCQECHPRTKDGDAFYNADKQARGPAAKHAKSE